MNGAVKRRCQDDAGNGKDDLDVVLGHPGAEPAVGTEQQHEYHAGDDRRYREWKVDQRDQQVFAGKLELGNAPGGRHPEDQIDRHRDRRHEQRQLRGTECIRLRNGFPVRRQPLRERLDEHQGERENQNERQKYQRHADQGPADRP